MENKVLDATSVSKSQLNPVLEAVTKENGQKFRKSINTDCVVVGRSDQADMTLPDQKLSRNHFMIIKEKGKYRIKDLNSTNGIYVNGKKTIKCTLTGNDEIHAGSSFFHFMLTNNDYNKQGGTPNKIAFRPSPFTFDKKYTKKKIFSLSNKKQLIISISIGFVVSALALTLLSNEKEAKLAPIAKQTVKPLTLSNSILKEIEAAGLSEEDKIKALNYYKLAEYHFSNAKNYALAKKSMEAVYALLPNSEIAPAFIAGCEEAINKFKGADDHLDQITEDKNKRDLIDGLIKSGYSELGNKNYADAISIFEKVIAIDKYNNTAYDGILEAEKSMQDSTPLPPETVITKGPSSNGKIYAKLMKKAFKNADYITSYELAEKILKMGRKKAGSKYFLQALRTKNETLDVTNNLYKGLNTEARLLAKSEAKKDAISTYKQVLSLFPYNKEALDGIKTIYKKLHDEAKLVYSKALVEESMDNLNDAKAKFKMVLNLVPSSDSYYKKAKNKLKKYEG